MPYLQGGGMAAAARQAGALGESLQLILQQGQREWEARKGVSEREGPGNSGGKEREKTETGENLKGHPITLLLQQGHNLFILPQQFTN